MRIAAMISRKILLILLGMSICLCQKVVCQDAPISAEIKDVRALNDNEMLITYEVKGDPEENFVVKLFLRSEKDPSLNLKLTTLKGDLEGNIAGRVCQITWNHSVDYPNAALDEGYFFKIEGSRVSSGGGWPWYYYAGGAALVGGAVVLLTSGGSETPPAAQATIPTPPPRP
jgi:hypothetical protein